MTTNDNKTMSREKAKEFFDIVRKMREAQKAYFMTRTKETLERSKRLWGYVDRFAYLDDLLPERKEETNGGR